MRGRVSCVSPHQMRGLSRATGLSSGARASLRRRSGHPLSSQAWALSVLTAPRLSSRSGSGDLNSPLGQNLLCPRALSEEEMPSRCSLGFRSSHFLFEDLPFPGPLTERLLISFGRGTAAPLARAALQGGPHRAAVCQQP